MKKRINRTLGILGFWSALFSLVFGIAYIVFELVNQIGLLSVPDSLIGRMFPSLLLAPTFLVLLATLHYSVSEEKRVFSHIAIMFGVVYAVMVSVVYYVQVTLMVPAYWENDFTNLELLIYDLGTFMYAINVLGYTFMSLSTLFLAPIFDSEGTEKIARYGLFANGILAPVLALQMVSYSFFYIGIAWIVTFPLSMVIIAWMFHQSRPDTS